MSKKPTMQMPLAFENRQEVYVKQLIEYVYKVAMYIDVKPEVIAREVYTLIEREESNVFPIII